MIMCFIIYFYKDNEFHDCNDDNYSNDNNIDNTYYDNLNYY